MTRTLRLLILEDEPDDAELLLHNLRRAGIAVVAQRVEDEAGYRKALLPDLDLILADYHQPQFNALLALKIMQEHGLNVPFIIVSGVIGEDQAVEAIKLGAWDYLLKDRLGRLGEAVRRALGEKVLREERRKAEGALQAHLLHQTALAQLSQLALTGTDITTLMEEAALMVAQTIEVPYVHVLEFLAEEGMFRMRAGYGWQQRAEPRAVAATAQTQAGYTLTAGEPVIMADLAGAGPFAGDPLIAEIGARSTMSVIIFGAGRSFGVLGVHALEPRRFSVDEHHFLQAVANVLAEAVERERTQEALRVRETRYRELFDNALEPIYVHDRSGNFLEFNRAAERITGYSRSEALGMNLLDMVAPESREAAQRMIEQAGLGCETIAGEIELLTRDGTHVFLEVNTRPIHEAGRPVGAQGVARDITARRHAERRAATLLVLASEINGTVEREKLLDSVYRHAAASLPCDAMVFFEYDTVEGFRPAWQSGVPHDMIPVAGPLPEGLADALHALREEGSTCTINDAGQAAWMNEGLRLHIGHLVATPLCVHGHHLGVLVGFRRPGKGAFADAEVELFEGIARQLAIGLQAAELFRAERAETERCKTLIEQQAALVAELERANRTKAEFIATISHELRTPLNVILGYTDLMLDGIYGTLNDEQRHSLQRVMRSASELADLVNSTLELNLLNQGGVATDVRPIDFAALARQVGDSIRTQREEKPQIEIEWSFDGDLSAFHSDPGKLQAVLRNLLSNALKFSDRGKVEVCVRGRKEGVEISVSDQGIGITPEVLPIIFEPFRQGDGSFTRRHGGAGLGLYVVRRMIDLLGGSITVESEPGVGSTFCVWVPDQLLAPSWSDRSAPLAGGEVSVMAAARALASTMSHVAMAV